MHKSDRIPFLVKKFGSVLLNQGRSRLNAVRKITDRFHNRAIVLLYHRVSRLECDPQLLCVSPKYFSEQMEYIAQNHRPISLDQLRDSMLTGMVPDKGVVVTFDDGYADNLWNAKPVLERFSIPATIFVSNGFVDQNIETYSDVLDRTLLGTKNLPKSLELIIQDKTYLWQFSDVKFEGDAWDVTMGNYPTDYHKCYHELHSILRPMDDSIRQQIGQELISWAMLSNSARQERRILTTDELRTISEDGLIKIGSHGVSHLLMSSQSKDAQAKEAVNSKRELESIIGSPIKTFAYPYGGRTDFTKETVEIVKQSGYELACANYPGTVKRHSDLFRMPRMLVRDWDGAEFASRLKSAFGD